MIFDNILHRLYNIKKIRYIEFNSLILHFESVKKSKTRKTGKEKWRR